MNELAKKIAEDGQPMRAANKYFTDVVDGLKGANEIEVLVGLAHAAESLIRDYYDVESDHEFEFKKKLKVK